MWRYQCLGELAQQLGCRAVLTGHTASDRAETLLINLMRGAGADGMKVRCDGMGVGSFKRWQRRQPLLWAVLAACYASARPSAHSRTYPCMPLCVEVRLCRSNSCSDPMCVSKYVPVCACLPPCFRLLRGAERWCPVFRWCGHSWVSRGSRRPTSAASMSSKYGRTAPTATTRACLLRAGPWLEGSTVGEEGAKCICIARAVGDKSMLRAPVWPLSPTAVECASLSCSSLQVRHFGRLILRNIPSA